MVRDSASVSRDEWVRRKETIRREKTLVGRFNAAGVGILAGTDDSNPFVIPGFSLHEELALLVDLFPRLRHILLSVLQPLGASYGRVPQVYHFIFIVHQIDRLRAAPRHAGDPIGEKI